MAKDVKNNGEAQSNRPENTKFKQQKLDAWQPILTPAWVIGTFIVIGLVFVPVGAYLWKLSDDLYEAVVTYDSYDKSLIDGGSAACQISKQDEGYAKLKNGTASYNDCTVEVTFNRDIDESDTVFVYYEIDNFYQNHRRYVKSVSESQLDGSTVINPLNSNGTGSALETSCDPSQSFSTSTTPPGTNRIFYPCGLIALSFFNDEIQIQSFQSATENITYAAGIPTSGSSPLEIKQTGIAWQSDLKNKYRNPTATDCVLSMENPGGNLCPLRYFQYQYLWQTYDQFLCYPSAGIRNGTSIPDVSQPPSQCKDFTTYVNEIGQNTYSGWDTFIEQNLKGQNVFFGKGCVACVNQSDVLVPAGGIRPPLDNTSATSPFGLRDEEFIVWMRTAGLPVFRKLYGKLVPPTGGFKKGDKIAFTVVSNFLVESIQGSKALVLGTTSPLGGKNDILGIAYMAVGGICLFLAALFGIKMKLHPRKLGDPQYLQWKNK